MAPKPQAALTGNDGRVRMYQVLAYAPPWSYLWNPLFATDKILRVLRIAFARKMRVLGIGAQRTTPARECFPGCDNGIRSDSLLYPTDGCAQQIEIVQCGGATPAVPHAWNQEQPAPTLHPIHTAVRLAHGVEPVVGDDGGARPRP